MLVERCEQAIGISETDELDLVIESPAVPLKIGTKGIVINLAIG